MPPKLSPRVIVLLGAALVVLSVVLGVVSQALLGQQTSETLASIPLWVLSVVSWCGLTAQVLGLALIAVAIGVRALEPSARGTSASASREVRL